MKKTKPRRKPKPKTLIVKPARVTTATAPKPPPPPAPAAILQIKTWITEGQQAADILQSAAEMFPKEQPDVLLPAALDELAAEFGLLDTDVARGFLMTAYREIYRRAFEIADFGNAMAALRNYERQVKLAEDANAYAPDDQNPSSAADRPDPPPPPPSPENCAPA